MSNPNVEIRIQCSASEAEDLLLGIEALAKDGQIDGVDNISVVPILEESSNEQTSVYGGSYSQFGTGDR